MKDGPVGVAVIGTGRIARRFAADLRYSRSARIVAVGGRSLVRATELARAIGPGVAAGGIEEAMARQDVEVVYVATSNAAHAEHALMAIAFGKPVLVEKPLATRAQDALRVAEAARSAGVFAMEAMWMRFTPGIRRLKTWVDAGELDQVQHLSAGVSFRHDAPLGEEGGALWDLGVYPISLALHLLGSADRVVALGRRSSAGVVIDVDLILSHKEAMSSLSCGWSGQGANRATLQTEGAIVETSGSMLCPPLLTVRRLRDAEDQNVADEAVTALRNERFGREHALREMVRPLRLRRVPTLFEGTGLHYQVDHMVECFRRGLIESPVMPLDETYRTLRLIEDALAQID